MKYIKTRDALQAFYYLIAVDGSVRDDERALFDHIGDNLDAKHFHDYRKEIIDSCDERINQCHDSDDRYDVIVEGVDAVLSHRTDKRAAGIAPRLLLWNMLSVAFADGEYDAVESRLIRHIARTMIADRSIYPEMEHLMRAAYDVRGELDWISNSELPYSEVRPMVDQLEERVNVLQNAAVLLIEDETAAPAPEVMVPEKDVFDQTKDAVDSVVAPVVDQVQQGAQGAADAVKHTFDDNVAPVLNQVGDALKPVNDAVLKPVATQPMRLRNVRVTQPMRLRNMRVTQSMRLQNVRAMRPMLYKASSVASLDANKRNPGRNSLCHFLLFHYSSEWPLLPVPQAWVWLPKVVLISTRRISLTTIPEHAFDGQLITSKSFVGNVQIP